MEVGQKTVTIGYDRWDQFVGFFWNHEENNIFFLNFMIDNFTLLLFQWLNVCVGVVIYIIPTVSTFVFFCKAFLRSDILMIYKSKAFLLFLALLRCCFECFCVRMAIASTMEFLFISQCFFLYSFISNQQNGERLLFHFFTWISLL